MTNSTEAIENLISDGQTLSAELQTVKTYTDKRKVEDYGSRVVRFRNRVKRMDKELADQIRECQKWRGALSILEEDLKADKDEAKSYFWRLHNGEVEVQSGGEADMDDPFEPSPS